MHVIVVDIPCEVWDSLASYTDTLCNLPYPKLICIGGRARDSQVFRTSNYAARVPSRSQIFLSYRLPSWWLHTCTCTGCLTTQSGHCMKSNQKGYFSFVFYSQSSPCDHSGKWPAQVTTIFVKPHLSFVMKSSNKQLFPQATVITFDYSSFVFKLL